MKKGLTIVVVLMMFVGVALLAGCGGSGSSAPTAVRDASAASLNGIRNGLTGACEAPDVANADGAAEHNPNCALVCDPDDLKCNLGRASATGLLKGVCGACANNPVVAASNPNCALCCDPDDVKCP